MADAKSDPSNPFGLPNFDLSQILRAYQMPGLDIPRMMEAQRKNIEAVREANEALMQGWQRMAEKQSQVFREFLDRWQQAVQENASGQQLDPQKQAELAQAGFERALQHMREMAEITGESQSKAFEVMRQRMEENIQAYFTDQGQDTP